jgi:hypothetical protein
MVEIVYDMTRLMMKFSHSQTDSDFKVKRSGENLRRW